MLIFLSGTIAGAVAAVITVNLLPFLKTHRFKKKRRYSTTRRGTVYVDQSILNESRTEYSSAKFH